jgi:hypothetical protein
MRHFSCDLCGKDMTSGSDARFVVRMEAFPAAQPGELTEADLDQDHIDTMAEMLAELEELEESGEHRPCEPSPERHAKEYDLCAACYQKFLADPLGRDRSRKPHFSKN